MDPLTAITIGSIAAGGIGNLTGGLSRARQLASPEVEREMRRQQALRDEAARQFAQEARAGMGGQMLDVQQAGQQQAALMAAQGGFTGREQMNAALALQEQRAAQEQALRAEQAKMQMQIDMQRAQENAAFAQREADARAARTQAVAGTLGTAAQQSLGVAQQAAAMRAQQSYQQDLLEALARPEGQQAAAVQAQQSFGDAALAAFGQDPLEMSDLDFFGEVGADVYMDAQQGQFLGVV